MVVCVVLVGVVGVELLLLLELVVAVALGAGDVEVAGRPPSPMVLGKGLCWVASQHPGPPHWFWVGFGLLLFRSAHRLCCRQDLVKCWSTFCHG